MRFDPAGPLRGALRPPPDKSISHRAAILAAIGEGRTGIASYLDSLDTRATLRAVAALGAGVEDGPGPHPGALRVEIAGLGLRGLRDADIDVGNAGTLLRILPGWLAGQGSGRWRLDGDASIRSRPVDRVAEPLREMGARVSCREGRLPPLEVEGAELRGITYALPVASAQVKSCLLLAGLLAEGETTIIEPVGSRDHTERMLAAAGAPIERAGAEVRVRGAGRLDPGPLGVPGDLSAAAFPLVAALLVPGSEIRLADVGVNPTRSGLLTIARRMGATIEAEAERDLEGEPVADLDVRHGELRGARVGASEVPGAIDELPLIALLGCFAAGETVVSGAEELRRKESDRIAAVTAALRGIGAEIEARPDGFAVRGTGGLRGGAIDSGGDHRIAMLGAIAGLASREGVEVGSFEAAEVSYPRFAEDLAGVLAR